MALDDIEEGDEDYNTGSEDDAEDEDDEWSHGHVASLFSLFGVSMPKGEK
jgi:hypothetical protein